MSKSGDWFCFFEILDLEKVRIDIEILYVLYIQPEIRKVIIVYIYDLGFLNQPSRSRNFFLDPWPQKCYNRHQDQLCIMITKSYVLGTTLNSSVVVQGRTVKLRPCLRFPACGWGCVRWKAPCKKRRGWYVKLTWLALLSLYYIL